MGDDSIQKALSLVAESGLSNYAIAKGTGISESTIGNYKRGKTTPTPANARILLYFFQKQDEESVTCDIHDQSLKPEKVVCLIDRAFDNIEEERKLANRIQSECEKRGEDSRELITVIKQLADRLVSEQ